MDALHLAVRYKPAAITLDLRLGDMDGWLVIELLKNNPEVRHIPVCVISVEEDAVDLLRKGVSDFICKPVSGEDLEKALERLSANAERDVRKLLVVMHDEERRGQLEELVAGKDVKITAVDTLRKAVNQLKSRVFDCIVVDNDLPDLSMTSLVRDIQKNAEQKYVPIILHTSRKPKPGEDQELEDLMRQAVLKEAKTWVQLLEDTALFLHRKAENMAHTSLEKLVRLHSSDEMIAFKKVLVVDDDIRNIFALTTILERHNMVVLPAENGHDALVALEQNPDIDIVLMDIMMPVMDGYETTQTIRKQKAFADLPIIALTAKAMKGDRERCLEAGASDYITKPVNSAQLLTMIRHWLGNAVVEAGRK